MLSLTVSPFPCCSFTIWTIRIIIFVLFVFCSLRQADPRKGHNLPVELGDDDFSASNGWLQKWQARHGVWMAVLSGEAADVNPGTVADWVKRLPEVCDGYSLENIFNCDKTACSIEQPEPTLFSWEQRCPTSAICGQQKGMDDTQIFSKTG